MHTIYRDILDRITEPPLWFDEHAVPRFDPFTPASIANIYAREAVLILIECQGCGRPFKVAISQSRAFAAQISAGETQGPTGLLRHEIWSRKLRYGDPPNMECCAAGATMNSVPQRVLEYWVQPYALGEGIELVVAPNGRIGRQIRDVSAMDWRREPELEIDILPDWARKSRV